MSHICGVFLFRLNTRSNYRIAGDTYIMIFNIIRRLFILDEIIGQTTEGLLEIPYTVISNIMF